MNPIGSTDTIGVDLGDKFSYACVLDFGGQIQGRFRLRTTPTAFRTRFGALQKSLVAIETGTHSPWVSRVLEACGHRVLVANSRRVKLISENRKKTDRADCELLARIARADPTLLAPITHRDETSQQDLAVLRARAATVRARTLLINSARGLVKASGGRIPAAGSTAFCRVAREAIPDGLRPAVEPQLNAIELLTQQIKSYDRQVAELATRHSATKLLQAIPGVGPICSLAFVLTVEDPHRFRRSRQVGAYFGLVPRLDESGNSSPQLRITKAGDVDVRSLLVISAQYVLGPFAPDSDLRRWGLALTERGGKNSKKRAVVAVARRLAVLMHHLWRTGEVYDPLFLARQRGEADDLDKARPGRARRKKTNPTNEEAVLV
ncbi:IS110 family transposase [Planctomycetota bacterium]|nr:IS110 family transposase [Planctomycetota bacterium]